MASRIPPLNEPSDLTDPLKIADWLELKCLRAADGNVSRGDLERLLKRSGIFERDNIDQDASIDGYCIDVFEELEFRAQELGDYYPFVVDNTLLSKQPRYVAHYSSYIFCLCLSYFGSPPEGPNNLNPRLLFENLCAVASAEFFSGESLVFGTGRASATGGGIGFAGAVNDLALFLGEGGGLGPKNTLNKQDDHVDLVTIKRADNSRASNLIVFGQCASGNDWPKKLSELNPDAFWLQWMKEGNVSALGRAFFIPHCLSEQEFVYSARRGGYFFERIRTAKWAASNRSFAAFSKRCESWIEKQV